jgi:hypothetical protein
MSPQLFVIANGGLARRSNVLLANFEARTLLGYVTSRVRSDHVRVARRRLCSAHDRNGWPRPDDRFPHDKRVGADLSRTYSPLTG